MERGDASNLDWCALLKSRIRTEFGRLELLVCNAAPAIHGLRLEEAFCHRIRSYVESGFALVAAPLCAFLELVSETNGRVLVISSIAVEQPPVLWPHYVALKAAVEGLAQTAAVAHPKVTIWIARPGRISTGLSDTPLSRLEAEPPADVARRILQKVYGSAVATGTAHLCR
jgi:NAD(P)-dependent dehydrogenase (short-subunit alcohol dehydrogenase family)